MCNALIEWSVGSWNVLLCDDCDVFNCDDFGVTQSCTSVESSRVKLGDTANLFRRDVRV